jgi:hypothetical protein
MLGDFGFDAVTIQRSPSESRTTELHDLTQGSSPATVRYLARMLDATVITETPPADGSDSFSGIRILLAPGYRLPAPSSDDVDPNLRTGYAAPIYNNDGPAAQTGNTVSNANAAQSAISAIQSAPTNGTAPRPTAAPSPGAQNAAAAAAAAIRPASPAGR